MTLARLSSAPRLLAALGLVAAFAVGCSVPTASVTPSPSPATPMPVAPSFTLAASPSSCPTSAPAAYTGKATVVVHTNFGDITIEVDGSLGANAAGAFLALAKCGYYNNVLVHRVVASFVIQTGDGQYARLPDVNPDKMGQGSPGWTIPDDKVTTKYVRGTVAMARTSAANSGSTQWFIVLDDTAATSLASSATNNYAIFGSVSAGMDVVDKITLVPLGGDGGSAGTASMPLIPVVITGTTVTEK
jgi:cyclophilin family peptidyl-prolyl cis-trans isomerase